MPLLSRSKTWPPVPFCMSSPSNFGIVAKIMTSCFLFWSHGNLPLSLILSLPVLLAYMIAWSQLVKILPGIRDGFRKASRVFISWALYRLISGRLIKSRKLVFQEGYEWILVLTSFFHQVHRYYWSVLKELFERWRATRNWNQMRNCLHLSLFISYVMVQYKYFLLPDTFSCNYVC
jgi:hypothetical protein